MEPRPQSSRPAHSPASTRQSSSPSGGGGETRSFQPTDPATAAAPSRADYDYSPLDLAPPGQRRRRQLVAAVLGGLVMVLLVGGVVFAFLMLRDDDDPDDEARAVAVQTVVAANQEADVPGETVAAAASSTEPAAANESGSPESGAPTEVPEDAESQSTAGDAAAQALEPTPAQPAQDSAASGALTQDQLLAMLPDVSAVPQGLDSVTEATRTLTDVVDALGGSRAAETQLQNWGWSGNVERVFQASDASVVPQEEASFISVSLHGFANEQAAAEALPFYSDILLNGGYVEAPAVDIGSASRLLVQPQEEGGTQIALYVQDGSVLYRFGGSSLAGDPTLDVLGVASATIGQ